jgi:hypothetical protein
MQAVREERIRLIKIDITGNLNATNNRIPTMISLTLSVNQGRHTGPIVSIALASHEVGGQRQHNQKNEGGYTAVAVV